MTGSPSESVILRLEATATCEPLGAKVKLRRCSERGFTLVELLVVIALIAAVTAMVGWRFSPVYHQARNESFTQQLLQLEQQARMRAFRSGQPLWLVYDLRRQQLRVEEAGEKDRHARRVLRFPGSQELRVVQLAQHPRARRRVIRIPVDRHGQTPAYGLRWRQGTKEQWMVLAGVTGIWERIDDEKVASARLRQLASRRHDTP